MNPRKKQPAVTRLALLEAAGAEFSRSGYAGGALGAIAAAAGVTKGALFHHFPDKRSLAKAWIGERLAAEIEVKWARPLTGAGSLTALKQWCRARTAELDPAEAYSTLAALAAELGKTEPLLAAELEAVFAHLRQALADLFERGRLAGWIFHAVKPAHEAAMLVAVLTGIAVVGAVGGREVIQAALASLDDYLDTLRAQGG